MREAANAVIINNKKVLLVKKEDVWILPGGKIEQNESHLECLVREVKEELSGTKITNPLFYTLFEGISPHKGDIVRAYVYFVEIIGGINKPSSEIKESKYFIYEEANNYFVSDITKKVLIELKQDKYI